MGTCEVCGKELVKPAKGRPQTRFCSRQCKEAARSAELSERIMARRVGRTCAQCGKPIPEERNNRSKTCSRECGVAYQNSVRATASRQRWEEIKPPCRFCGAEIPSDRHAGSLYCSVQCKRNALAARWREKSPHYMRQYLYGVTAERFAELMAAQGGRCAICRSDQWPGKGNRPHVDHDHTTGAVRGLLCGKCNFAIGQMDDDPSRLRAAAAYLEK